MTKKHPRNGWSVQELRTKRLTMRAIAAELGCSVGTVHRCVKEAQEQKTT